jgi:hypothetical protein
MTADVGDDVVTELTVAEFHDAARAALASLGVTYAGLAEQARRGDFESARANMLWKAISGALPDGFA